MQHWIIKLVAHKKLKSNRSCVKVKDTCQCMILSKHYPMILHFCIMIYTCWNSLYTLIILTADNYEQRWSACMLQMTTTIIDCASYMRISSCLKGEKKHTQSDFWYIFWYWCKIYPTSQLNNFNFFLNLCYLLRW